MKKIILSVSLFIIAAGIAKSQTTAEEVKALYSKAETELTAKNYDKCSDYLDRTLVKLNNKTNAQVEYLYTKNLYTAAFNDPIPASGKFDEPGHVYKYYNLHTWNSVEAHAKTFLSVADKKTFPADKYNEILNIKITAEDNLVKLNTRRQKYLSFKQREANFIRDTLNPKWLIFCDTYNKLYKKGKMKWTQASKSISYDPGSHIVTVTPKDFIPGLYEIEKIDVTGMGAVGDTTLRNAAQDENDIELQFFLRSFYKGQEFGHIVTKQNQANRRNVISIKQVNRKGISAANDFDFSAELTPLAKDIFNNLKDTGFREYFYSTYGDVLTD